MDYDEAVCNPLSYCLVDQEDQIVEIKQDNVIIVPLHTSAKECFNKRKVEHAKREEQERLAKKEQQRNERIKRWLIAGVLSAIGLGLICWITSVLLP